MTKYLEFLNYIKQISECFKAYNFSKPVPVISHLDADGISACSILNYALKTEGIPFTNHIYPQLTETDINEINKLDSDFICITDLGSGQIKLIREIITDKTILILDHHDIPEEELEIFNSKESKNNCSNKIYHVNPHFFDIDGGTEISGSGVVYFFAKALNNNSVKMAHIALVGAIGDVQEQQGEFISLNKIILSDAIEENLLSQKKDIKFYGVQTRSLPRVLSGTNDPVIPGVSNSESGAIKLLHEAGIDVINKNKWKFLRDLTDEEKEKLILAIIERRKEFENPSEIFGNFYILKGQTEGTPFRDAKEFATLLNSCGRIDEPNTGVGACLNEDEHKIKALEHSKAYKKQIMNALLWFKKNKQNEEFIINNPKYMIINAKDKVWYTIIGTIISILTKSGEYNDNYVMLSMARAPRNLTKISIRKVESLKIPDKSKTETTLKEIIEEICTITGGDFGGHDNAAGALINTEDEGKFIAVAKEIMDKRLN